MAEWFQDADLEAKFRKLEKEVKEQHDRTYVAPPPNLSKGVTAYDPMSPYEYRPTKEYFSNLAEIINEKSFHGSYPQSYTPVPEYFKKHGYSPYYDPEEFMDYARGALTIANMIELTANNQPWKLDRVQDMYLIRSIVEQYRAQMNLPTVVDDVRVKAYKQRVELFLRRLNKSINIYEHANHKNVKTETILDKLKKLLGGK